MNIPNDVLSKVEKIINSMRGGNIGTGMQMDLEQAVNNVLPGRYKYQFIFNMSGMTKHVFHDTETGETVEC